MSKFKVGDLVIPNMGPHKGKEHKIIGIKDGKYNITPTKIMPRKIKYKLGAAAAKEDQITMAESYDGRTRDGKKFVERMNKRAEVIKAAKESAAKKAKGDEGDKLIKGAAEAGKNISLTIEDDLKEAASLKKVPAAVMKNLGGADKKQLAKILDDKADLSDKASEKLYDKLFDYYSTNGMPYGTASARDGDPYEWIIDQIS